MRSSSSVEDVGELMQNIQSRLPAKDAGRTSVLSKSWLQAWSTIPSLSFYIRERKHLMVVDRTLNRYFRDNIPIERFELDIDIADEESASHTENWIRSLATKTWTLKELSLSFTLSGASLTLPDEILSAAKNLTKLTVVSSRGTHSLSMKNNAPIIVNCVSLREVSFKWVCITQEVFNAIFSSCSLLENIQLSLFENRVNTIKIRNLAHLREINIYSSHGRTTDLEISHVPNLRMFTCNLFHRGSGPPLPRPFSAYSISLGSGVTELWLGGLITDDASLDMIKSGFLFLESLTLEMECWTLPIFHFTCASLEKLSLMWPPTRQLTDIQVHAPKLLSFLFRGYTLPSLSFPVSTLDNTMLNLIVSMPVDVSFFLQLREALTLSRTCDLHILDLNNEPKSDIDLDELRKRLTFPPAKNVQQLEFQADMDDSRSPFVNALFEICHPKHVLANPDITTSEGTNHFFELMLREFLDKMKKRTRRPYWPRQLKHVQIKLHEKWETLRNSHRNFVIDWPIDFKLHWR